MQSWLTPVWKYIGHGCHLDRDHLKMIREEKDEQGNRLFENVQIEEIDKEEKEVDGMVGGLQEKLFAGEFNKADVCLFVAVDCEAAHQRDGAEALQVMKSDLTNLAWFL